MLITIELPDFDQHSIDVIWDENAEYKINIIENEVCIRANAEGLMSLAKQMVYLANKDIPSGAHVHYDSFFTNNTLSDYELVVEKR